uniref:Uncharacterized protein n=1 Tax=Anguilla anguilla TaxID=7936 RepID=A0A0E9U7P6_ANGAN
MEVEGKKGINNSLVGNLSAGAACLQTFNSQ